MEALMKGLVIAQEVQDFNNAIKNLNDPEYLVCFTGNEYNIDDTYTKEVYEVFEVFPFVDIAYGDIKGNVISFPPFSPSKYYLSFMLDSPIIVRTNIGELMGSDNYFDRVKLKHMSYHLPIPLFIKKV